MVASAALLFYVCHQRVLQLASACCNQTQVLGRSWLLGNGVPRGNMMPTRARRVILY
jgi:hypothetical protein